MHNFAKIHKFFNHKCKRGWYFSTKSAIIYKIWEYHKLETATIEPKRKMSKRSGHINQAVEPVRQNPKYRLYAFTFERKELNRLRSDGVRFVDIYSSMLQKVRLCLLLEHFANLFNR